MVRRAEYLLMGRLPIGSAWRMANTEFSPSDLARSSFFTSWSPLPLASSAYKGAMVFGNAAEPIARLAIHDPIGDSRGQRDTGECGIDGHSGRDQAVRRQEEVIEAPHPAAVVGDSASVIRGAHARGPRHMGKPELEPCGTAPVTVATEHRREFVGIGFRSG